MKNFDDFKATITSDILENIKNETVAKLNRHLDENPIESPAEEFIWFNRCYNADVTMRLLERYHNWLHED